MAHHRLEEKKALSQLTNRFITYVRHVRQMKEDVDFQQIASSVQALEDELKALKNSYEGRISQLLTSMEVISKEKQDLEKQYSQKTSHEKQLLERLQSAEHKGSKLIDEVSQLKDCNVKKEEEIKQFDKINSQWKADFETLKEKQDQLEATRNQMHQKLKESENVTADMQTKLTALETKSRMSDDYQHQTIEDLRQQLENGMKRMVELEKAVKAANDNNSELSLISSQIQEDSRAEKARCQQQIEAFYNETIHHLQLEVEEEKRNRRSLDQTNDALKKELQHYTNCESQVQGELQSIRQDHHIVEQALHHHREDTRNVMETLESRMREMQDLMVVKMNEVQTGEQSEVSLKEEIAALKDLLHKEEERLKIKIISQKSSPLKDYNAERARNQQYFSSNPLHSTSDTVICKPISTETTDIYVTTDNTEPGDGESFMSMIEPQAPLDLKTSMDNAPGSVGPVVKKEKDEPKTAGKPLVHNECKLGDSPDYFETMFKQSRSLDDLMVSPDTTYGVLVDSVVSHFKLQEVDKSGGYIRVSNTSSDQDVEVGGYFIQVNHGKEPVVIYRFPAQTKLACGETITVWSELGIQSSYIAHTENQEANLISLDEYANSLHRPPHSYVWRELETWPCSEFHTTILCQPSGQAISWLNSVPRPIYHVPALLGGDLRRTVQPRPNVTLNPVVRETTELTLLAPYPRSVQSAKTRGAYLRHPHTVAPHEYAGSGVIHPSADAPRLKVFGNDHISHNRQTRIAQSLSCKGRRDGAQFTEPPDPENPRGPYTGKRSQAVGLMAYLKSHSMDAREETFAQSRATIKAGPDVILRANMK